MAEYVTLDSGEREEYDSGMRRDSQAGKPRYDLIDATFLRRWAELMARGAEKYGEDNWRLADSEQELKRFKASALRHIMQWFNDDTDEDHAVAASYNLAAAEMVKAKLAAKQSEHAAWVKAGHDSFLEALSNERPAKPMTDAQHAAFLEALEKDRPRHTGYDKGRWLVHGVSMNDEQYTTFIAAQAKARATVSSDEVINNEGRW